jgi:hypothetical protein
MLQIANVSNGYQTGRIVLRLDRAYAQKVDWAKIFPVRTEYTSTAEHSLLAVASDGTSFVLNGITSQISKFSPTGDLLVTWGKRGRKPGEFPSQPRSLMLMDDRYVLAADTSMRQVNMYDLNGKFLRMLQVKFPNYQMVPLVRGKFAISSSIGLPGWKTKRFAAIINLDEGKEKIVAVEIEEIEMDHDKRARSFISRTREGKRSPPLIQNWCRQKYCHKLLIGLSYSVTASQTILSVAEIGAEAKRERDQWLGVL